MKRQPVDVFVVRWPWASNQWSFALDAVGDAIVHRHGQSGGAPTYSLRLVIEGRERVRCSVGALTDVSSITVADEELVKLAEVYREVGDEVAFHELPRLSTREVGAALGGHPRERRPDEATPRSWDR